MTQFDDAIQAWEAALEERSIDARSYLLPGLAAANVQQALESASLPVTDGVVEWFGYCGGVVPGSKTGHVLQGRGYYALSDAIAALSDDSLEYLPLPSTPFLPLTVDHPVLLMDLEGGAVLESDVETGLKTLAASIGDWVTANIDLLPKVGPIAGARTLSPIAIQIGTTEFIQIARDKIGRIAALLNELDIVQAWIQCAPPNSLEGNHGLELRQVEEFLAELALAGHTLSKPEIIFKEQERKHQHRMWLILREA